MSDIAERLSKLSPEQRNILVQKIRKTKQESEPQPQPQSEKREFNTEDQNFSLKVGKLGDLESLTLEVSKRRAPGPGQVEIQIYATSLNFREVMIALGLYPSPSGKPAPMGGDCAGKVVAVGEGVTDLHLGDEVIAIAPSTFSAFTTTGAHDVVRKPANMSFVEAAVIPTVYMTAYYSLHHLARLAKGERVLIHSAAGGVGLAAVQVAQLSGAEIIATVGTSEKREYLKTLGVDKIANSRNPDFDEEVRQLTGGEGIDVILNSLAGDAIPKGLTLLRMLGRFIELGKRDLYGGGQLDFAPFRKFISFFSVDLGPVSRLRPALFHSLFTDIMEHFAKGEFRLPPIREFSIANISEAFTYMSQSEHIGKIGIRVANEDVTVLVKPASA